MRAAHSSIHKTNDCDPQIGNMILIRARDDICDRRASLRDTAAPPNCK